MRSDEVKAAATHFLVSNHTRFARSVYHFVCCREDSAVGGELTTCRRNRWLLLPAFVSKYEGQEQRSCRPTSSATAICKFRFSALAPGPSAEVAGSAAWVRRTKPIPSPQFMPPSTRA